MKASHQRKASISPEGRRKGELAALTYLLGNLRDSLNYLRTLQATSPTFSRWYCEMGIVHASLLHQMEERYLSQLWRVNEGSRHTRPIVINFWGYSMTCARNCTDEPVVGRFGEDDYEQAHFLSDEDVPF